MKRLTFILATLISTAIFAQEIKWTEDYPLENNKSLYDYIGSIEGNNYFTFGYRSTGFKRYFNRIGLMKTNAKNDITKYNMEYIEVPSFSLISSFVLPENIALLYSGYSKSEGETKVMCKIIDKNSLTEIRDRELFAFETNKKDDPSIRTYHSKDRSKIVISFYNYNVKTKESYLVFYEFNNSLEKLWANQYRTKQEGMLSVMDLVVADNGDIYVLSKAVSDNSKLIISKISEDDIIEYIVKDKMTAKETESINDVKLHIIDKDNIFIAYNDKTKLVCLTYNMNTEELKNTASFEYLKSKETFWAIKDILKLDNGSLVVTVEDSYTLIVYSTGSNSYSYYNRNFYAVCVNPNEAKPVYNQLLSRATTFGTLQQTEGGQFERPFYFTNGNDFYAIYNTDIKDNDLSNEIFIKTNINFYKGSKRIVSNQLKIDERGTPTQTTLFGYKETKSMFSPNISFQKYDGTIVLGRFMKDNISFGELNLNK